MGTIESADNDRHYRAISILLIHEHRRAPPPENSRKTSTANAERSRMCGLMYPNMPRMAGSCDSIDRKPATSMLSSMCIWSKLKVPGCVIGE
jgi:hypothetical protein